MPFYIEIMESGQSAGLLVQFANNGQTRPVEFETGRDASQFASAGNEGFRAASSNTRYKVKKSDGEIPTGESQAGESWRDRERARFADGTYSIVPWHNESWFLNSQYADLHFPHLSLDHPGKIAFTESESHGADDRQIRIRAGKYLRRYFADILDGSNIRDYAAQVSLETGEYGIRFATTPDEIESVYVDGPDSCMSHGANYYSSPCHPVRVYGAGDLAIAYMPADDDSDSIIARVLCWPDRKVYSRVYGDGGLYSERLVSGLQEMGYRHGSMSGARMLRIETDSHCGAFVAPYLDGTATSATDIGDFLEICHDGELDCQQTDGTTGTGYTCDMCGDSYDPDCEGTYIDSTDQNVCQCCYENHFFYCEDCESCHRNNDSVHIEDIGRTVCDDCARQYPECDDCGDRFSDNSLITVEPDSRCVCESCYSRYDYFECDGCGDHYESKQHNLCDGDSLCDDCEESWRNDNESEDDESEDDESEDGKPGTGGDSYSHHWRIPYKVRASLHVMTDYDRAMLESAGQMRLDFFAPGFNNPEPWRINQFQNITRNR